MNVCYFLVKEKCLKKNLSRLAAVFLLGVTSHAFAAGVSLGATRVIYPQGAKQVNLNIANSDHAESFLVQSWVSDEKGVKSPYFMVTPPLFVMKPAQANILRVMYVGPALPEDKESVFYFNNKAIPSTKKTDVVGNTLQIATQSVIKLFVRPAHLSMKSTDAPAALRCVYSNGAVTVNNPSPYFVTLVSFSVDGKKLPNTMVPPQSNRTISAPGITGKNISLQTLNDYGAITPVQTCKA